jgi:hypothetical protein
MKILDVPQSGSAAGLTSSRNRYGQYRRTRAIPVNPSSFAQQTARTRLSNNAAAWRTISDAQRSGWTTLGSQIQRTDSLGQSYTLNGFGAYCSVNNNLLAAGESTVDSAPGLISPTGLISATLTLTAVAFSVAYVTTPLGAGEKLFVYGSPQRAAGRQYESDYRLIFVSSAAAISPANILSSYTARFGVPVVGNRINLSLHVHLGGFRSPGLLTSAIVA